jgi:hypothetical protein
MTKKKTLKSAEVPTSYFISESMSYYFAVGFVSAFKKTVVIIHIPVLTLKNVAFWPESVFIYFVCNSFLI